MRNYFKLSSVIEETEREKKVKWFDDVIRINNERKIKQVFEARNEDRRKLGRLRRPRRDWEPYKGEMEEDHFKHSRKRME